MVATVLEIAGFVAFVAGLAIAYGPAVALAAAGAVIMLVGSKVGEP